jgi:hypothetical protein
MDIGKKIYELPTSQRTSTLVCIPTTSGTGSEVTPFSVVTDEKTGQKYPLVSQVSDGQMQSESFLLHGFSSSFLAHIIPIHIHFPSPYSHEPCRQIIS